MELLLKTDILNHNPLYKIPHDSFKLNAKSYNLVTIKNLAYSYIKEGSDNEKNLGEFILQWTDDSDSIALKTSGTTSNPKVIQIPKTAFINSAKSTGIFFKLSAGDSALCCLPFAYIAGKMMFVRAWVLGLVLDFIEPVSDPLQNCSSLYDFSAMVPMQVQNSLANLSKIRTLLVGGAPVSESLRDLIKDSTSNIFETYGMTETVSHVAAKNLSEGEAVFTSLPGITLDIDQNDCLIVKAPKLCSNPLQTNDVVSLISSRSFVWLGRFDHVINSGGIKIIPEQLESVLKHQIKNRFFISSAPDTVLGQKIILIIEGSPMDLQLDLKHIDPKKWPKKIHFTPKFFETKSGKIIRQLTLDSLDLNHT